MSNKIQIRRSISSWQVPSAWQLVSVWELFVNTSDERLFVSKWDWTFFELLSSWNWNTWVEVSVWPTNTLTNKWIFIETNWDDFQVFFEDWL